MVHGDPSSSKDRTPEAESTMISPSEVNSATTAMTR
jgi:hypothetical protein